MNILVRIAAAALLGTAVAAQAAEVDCDRPEAPDVPDGATATEGEIVEAGEAVRGYIASAQDFLACLEEKEASYGDDIDASEQALVDAIYNATVEAMNTAAADYNEAVRAFRAREDG